MVRLFMNFTFFAFLALSGPLLYAQDKRKDASPALVVVADVTTGMIAPEADFIGTVFYQETADVAAEVNGKIEEVLFEEGKRIRKGGMLVRLNSELLEKAITSLLASHEQVLADLENAKIELKRNEELYSQGYVPEQNFDEARFRTSGLEKKAESLKADIEGLKVQLEKKRVIAPFGGIIVRKFVDRGEWLEPGGKVAAIARDDVVDVIVNVPENVIRFVKPGSDVKVSAGSKEVTGKVSAVIPSGDIQTRTFPVKIQVRNGLSLIEGMEAKVRIRAGDEKKGLVVPRDAVINRFGSNVVFAVVDSKAKMVNVNVLSYIKTSAGVESSELKEGMKVVIKGNERLMNGQDVKISQK